MSHAPDERDVATDRNGSPFARPATPEGTVNQVVSVDDADVQTAPPLYREEVAPTTVINHDTEATQIQPLADVRDREAERIERDRQLGVVTRETTPTTLVSTTTTPVKRTTDKWHGSLALTVLRLITAAIVGIHGWQHLTHLTATKEYFSQSLLPMADWFAIGVSIAELVIAVLLAIGLVNRLAGLLLVVLEVGMLVFFIWGRVNPFSGRVLGFNGELELLLAGVGLLFLLLGSGGWGIDALFRRRRAAKRETRIETA